LIPDLLEFIEAAEPSVAIRIFSYIL